jgi:hypothetical protein
MKRESTMIRLALTVLPLAPAGAAHAHRRVPPYTIRRPNAGFTISLSATPAWWPGLFTQQKTPRESNREKTGVSGDEVSPLSKRLAQPSQ